MAYILPVGYAKVAELLKSNGVVMQALENDTTITVESYRIDEYKSYAKAYELHHKNYDVKVSTSVINKKFLKGDYIISTNQKNSRYIIEMLEPTGEDSFFAWNF